MNPLNHTSFLSNFLTQDPVTFQIGDPFTLRPTTPPSFSSLVTGSSVYSFCTVLPHSDCYRLGRPPVDPSTTLYPRETYITGLPVTTEHDDPSSPPSKFSPAHPFLTPFDSYQGFCEDNSPPPLWTSDSIDLSLHPLSLPK